MAKLVTKFKYLKPGSNAAGKYLKYIATREGVEMIDDSKKYAPATVKQKQFIEKMLLDFPDAAESLEYTDYIAKPNRINASELISRTMENNFDVIADSKTYADYIATRPRTQKFGSHGLFTDDGVAINLSKVSEELNNHNGNVWTMIVSLHREDAERLGFNRGERWRDMLRTQVEQLSTNLKIPMKNLRWYAAFHNESHHPHIHLIAYSVVENEGYLTRQGIERMRSSLASDIFQQDLISVYEKQTEHRREIKESSKDIMDKIISEINSGTYDNPLLEEKLLLLADKLSRTSGKKVYGYLKADVKSLIDSIADLIADDERVSNLYDLWYENKFSIIRTYTDELPDKIPLSQNKEFKSIRNMVIKEAISIDNFNITFDDEISTNPVMMNVGKMENYADDDNTDNDYSAWNSSKKYWKAKRFLDENAKEYNFEKGFALLKESAKEGNEYAQYKLGRMLIVNELSEEGIDEGVYWLEKSCEQGNQYAEYYLGKQYLGNGKVDENYTRAIYLLNESANQGNKYAMYSLACQYLFTDNFIDKVKEGLKLLEDSANQQFAPAEKMLAFIILKGELLPKDEKRAYNLLLHSVSLGDDKVEYALAKLLLNSEVIPKDTERAIKLLISAIEKDNEWAKVLLGKMLLFGLDIQKNKEKGIKLLQSAAEQGNEYAALILQNRENYLKYSITMSTMRLFGYMGNLFGKKFNTDKSKTGFRIDKKQYAQIQEKKLAQGLK